MTEEKKLKVVVPPEVLAQMEEMMGPEELQEMLAELQRLVDSGQLFEQSTPIDLETLEQDDPEMYAQMVEQMTADGYTDFDSWIESKSVPPTLN